jgi:hypothetical protein
MANFFVVRASDWGNRVWGHFEHCQWRTGRPQNVNWCVKASVDRCRSFLNGVDASEHEALPVRSAEELNAGGNGSSAKVKSAISLALKSLDFNALRFNKRLSRAHALG